MLVGDDEFVSEEGVGPDALLGGRVGVADQDDGGGPSVRKQGEGIAAADRTEAKKERLDMSDPVSPPLVRFATSR